MCSQVCGWTKSQIKCVLVNRFKITLTLRRIFKTLYFPDIVLTRIFARVVVVVSTSLCGATGDIHVHTCHAIVYLTFWKYLGKHLFFCMIFFAI